MSDNLKISTLESDMPLDGRIVYEANANVIAETSDGLMVINNSLCETTVQCDAYMANLKMSEENDSEKELLCKFKEIIQNQNNNAEDSQDIDKSFLLATNDAKLNSMTKKNQTEQHFSAINKIQITASGFSTNLQTSITATSQKEVSSSCSSTSSSSCSLSETITCSSPSTTSTNCIEKKYYSKKLENIKKKKKKKLHKAKLEDKVTDLKSSTETTDPFDNSKEVINCLKEFHIETKFDTLGILMTMLKSYSLGPLDELKCILCCVENFDLTGFVENHTRQTSVKGKISTSCSEVYLHTSGNKFCNTQKLENVAKYVSLFNPFCDEYCKKFYPNCVKRENIIKESNINNNNDKSPIKKQLLSPSLNIKCKPNFPPLPLKALTNQFMMNTSFIVNANNNNCLVKDSLSMRDCNSISASTINTLLNKDSLNDNQEDYNNNKNITYDNLIGCLRGFDLSNARQKYENSKKTILNFRSLSKEQQINSSSQPQSTTSFKIKCLPNDLLKFKPMPLNRDPISGNLIMNSELTKSLSKRAHDLTKNIISNRNLKISN